MYDSDSRGISYTAGFFMLIAFAIAGLLVASGISIPIWQQMTGLGFDQMAQNTSNPAHADALKIIQTITAVMGFLLPAIISAIVLSRRPSKLMGFSGKINVNQLGLVVLIMAASMVVSTSLSYFNYHLPLPELWNIRFKKMEEDYNQQVEAIVRLRNVKDYIIALIIMGFLPGLCEEALFRGGLQNYLSRATNKPWLAIVIVSILFSLAHFSFFGFLYRFFLGVVLGAIYQYSGRLWLSVFAHFLNNALALTVLFIYTQQGKSLREALKSDPTTFWGILALPVVIGLFFLFKRASAKRRLI